MKEATCAGLHTPLHRPDWTTQRFKFLFEKVQRVPLPHDEVVTAFRDGMVTLRANRRAEGYTFAEKEIGYQGINPGDLVIHAMDGFAGAIGVSDSRGKGSPVLTVLVPRAGASAHPRFWAYYLRHLAKTGFIASLSKGIRERSTDFRWKDAGNLLVNFPSFDEQGCIANFLDREIDRLDQLIAKKKHICQVLNEQREALVENAVNSHQGNGHADKVKLKWLVTANNAGEVIDKSHWGFGSEVLYTCSRSALKSGYKGFPGWKRACSADLLLTRNGTPYIHLPSNGAIYSNVVQRISLPGVDRRYLKYALENRVRSFRGYGVSIESFNYDMWSNLKVWVPEGDRQKSIADYIEAETSKFECIIGQINSSISLLDEYRSSLITQAVTGQIDVATWKDGTAANEQSIRDFDQEITL